MRLDYRATADERRQAIARADAMLQALKGKTPAEIDAWLTANVTTLAQTRTMMARMLYVLAHYIP